MLREFRPTILFLVKFFGVFLLFSLIYGAYIKSTMTGDDVKADYFTVVVTKHTVAVMNIVGNNWHYYHVDEAPFVDIAQGDVPKVSVFEGCNGVNIAILFFSFVFAFGGPLKTMAWFVPAGLIFIHVANIFRIGVLAKIAGQNEQAFYFFHKFGFTGIIYGAIFILWVIWVVVINKQRKKAPDETA
jgi:exosortase family protein XrtF